MNQHTLKNGSTSCTTRIAFPFTRLRAIPNQELMVIWWLESAAGSRQLPVLRIGIRSLARQPQTCALPQVAGAPKLKRESVLFSTYGATRRAAGARARRHLAGPTWGIEESFLFQVLGSPRYMYGWSPSLLRSAGRVLRTWCLSAGHRVAHLHRSSISSSASERSCSSAHFASRITGVRAKDVAARGMGARFHELLPPRISGSGGAFVRAQHPVTRCPCMRCPTCA
jgi:hypothetical protein